MEILIKGGPIMYLIFICAIFVITVFITRVIHLHRAQTDIQEFMAGLRNELVNKRITEAISICEETPGPTASVLKAGIMHHEDGVTGMEKAMEKNAVYEVSRMERNVSSLATIGVIAPLFGLLGTILGLMQVFNLMIQQGGLLTASDLAGGMWQAMLTTAFGIAVAIPAYIGYNYLVRRILHLVRDIEIGGVELVEILGAE